MDSTTQKSLTEVVEHIDSIPSLAIRVQLLERGYSHGMSGTDQVFYLQFLCSMFLSCLALDIHDGDALSRGRYTYEHHDDCPAGCRQRPCPMG